MTTPHGYWFMIHQNTGIRVRAILNDLPFYKHGPETIETTSGPALHLLVPGENELAFELYDAPASPKAPGIHGPARFTLHDEKDNKEVFVQWPDLWKEYPEEERKLPFVHRVKFVPKHPVLPPSYADAPRTEFGPEGTPELVDAARSYHDAFLRRDTDAFLAILAPKVQERERFYGPMPETSPAGMRAKIGGAFSDTWEMRPFDPKELVFESRAGGRVAYVTRLDGGYAIEAQSRTDPESSLQTDLFFMRRAGAWRLFL